MHVIEQSQGLTLSDRSKRKILEMLDCKVTFKACGNAQARSCFLPGSALAAMEPVPLHSLLHYMESFSKNHVRWLLKATEVHRVPDQKDKFLPVLSKFSLYLPLT